MLIADPQSACTEPGSYRDWHLPLAHDQLTLAQARADLARVSASAQDIPLMVQLVENPKYRIPGIELFHGRVELRQHDAIHILLGRGLLNKDEGFTIGFTMGSTRQVTSIEEELFVSIAAHLYPPPYRFGHEDIAVFRNGLRMAHIMMCKRLDNIDFTEYEQQPLAVIRSQIGIDRNLLRAYYALEKERYPRCASSRRLLDK